MPGLFDNLLDRDNPAKKLQKEIESTEFKKQSLIAPLQSEIAALTQKVNAALQQIGLEVYEAHINSEQIDEEAVHVLFGEISGHKTVILEKEAKLQEFAARYDEEINMLKANLASMSQPAPAQAPAVGTVPAAMPADGPRAFCTNCGGVYIPGEDLFCTGCGGKLE